MRRGLLHKRTPNKGLVVDMQLLVTVRDIKQCFSITSAAKRGDHCKHPEKAPACCPAWIVVLPAVWTETRPPPCFVCADHIVSYAAFVVVVDRLQLSLFLTQLLLAACRCCWRLLAAYSTCTASTSSTVTSRWGATCRQTSVSLHRTLLGCTAVCATSGTYMFVCLLVFLSVAHHLAQLSLL